ncbi:MAG: ABC transporter ATP-binding protein [Thermodesulfovibrio sp.]|nr:ABC transporter ATP-binding protein [Thermodesulfovibrio sp.]
MTDRAMIIFENVSKDYPIYSQVRRGIKSFLFNINSAIKEIKNLKFQALIDASFIVEKGESLGIIGRNGEGKSTILSLIAGVIKPTKGKIKINGKVFSLLELGSGFHPELTGRENIILNGLLLGFTRSEILDKIEKIIEFSELGDFIEQPIRTYSSGMIARLGFSVVTAAKPDILLIDEVLAVGDFAFQKKCIKKMLQFKEDGVTIVFVSHDMDAVRKICDKVLWLENHQVKMIGKVEEVIEKYETSFIK